MRVLHTSDWHLGRSLYGRSRYDEFKKFLDWLIETVVKERIDTLLVAGDIFDTTTPGSRAQHLYYSFLFGLSKTSCNHVVITSGNHDSPSFLSAPKQLLKILNVDVIGTLTDKIEDELIELYQENNELQAIICAVPYLRDRDIRTVRNSETIRDKELNLFNAMKSHYKDICDLALKRKVGDVPIIVMGHLFAAGGKTLSDDGVRELYVGSLTHIGSDIFPNYVDYVALGHLHVPQKVNGNECIRYSGSPIPMGFGEANQKKQVVIVEFGSSSPKVSTVNIPSFQNLERVTGTLQKVSESIQTLMVENPRSWLEVELTDDLKVPNIQEKFEQLISNSEIEIRCIKNKRLVENIMAKGEKEETLDDLTPQDVFNMCLDEYSVPVDNRQKLKSLYQEVLRSLEEEDSNL